MYKFLFAYLNDLPGTLKTVDCPGEYPTIGTLDVPQPYEPKPTTEFPAHAQDNGTP